jgi:hypothetical protein
MIEAEFGSTAADEMSVFHAFEAGNGTKPLKLAPIPRLMLLHADAETPPVTVTEAVAVVEPALFVAVSV